MPIDIHDAREENTNFGADTDPSIDPRRSWLVAAWLAPKARRGYPSKGKCPALVSWLASRIRRGSRRKTTNWMDHLVAAPAWRRPLSRTTTGPCCRMYRRYSKRWRECTWPFVSSEWRRSDW